MKYFARILKKNIVICSLLFSLGLTFATVSLRFSLSLSSAFPNMQTQKASLHFNTAGNDFGGSIYRGGLEAVSNDGVFLTGGNIACGNKIKGIYFNNQRGKRLWPLDQASLVKLQSVDSSYANLTLSGGLYTNCATGRNQSSIAGQITHTRRGTIFKLIAGVQMNSNNTYTLTYANTLQYTTQGILSGKIFDSYGGVASVFGTGLESGLPPPIVSTGNNQGGGTSSLKVDNCNSKISKPLPGANDKKIDYSPSYYDGTCVGPQSKIVYHNAGPLCSIYSRELNGAYEFARSYAITTINECKNVNVYGKLIRKDMAKMVVNFVVNILNRSEMRVANPACIKFNDIAKESDSTKLYIQVSCELGLMGLESDGVTVAKAFNPYNEVPRSEFGTVLSRLLRRGDNVAGTDEKYYTRHLQALQDANIMKKISDPSMKELRGRVLLMMQRIFDLAK